ncbi:hypothetical protein SORBI_3002G421350 [Sorghum bicolor]|uniref:Uncharacterized protein n=1 Tax=Sorghum bicolor TaxID=4558 RepID=A0A1W0W7X2_SORBI|nr:hypothetical protein SORBI_3002G421350 [Sorghum bicolor]
MDGIRTGSEDKRAAIIVLMHTSSSQSRKAKAIMGGAALAQALHTPTYVGSKACSPAIYSQALSLSLSLSLCYCPLSSSNFLPSSPLRRSCQAT